MPTIEIPKVKPDDADGIAEVCAIFEKLNGTMESLRLSWAATKGCVLRMLALDLAGFLVILLGFICLVVGVIPASLVAYLAWTTLLPGSSRAGVPIRGGGVEKTRVILIEYEVEAWACYPDFRLRLRAVSSINRAQHLFPGLADSLPLRGFRAPRTLPA